jgi:cytochrome b6-f complex iron-sulfur subunit
MVPYRDNNDGKNGIFGGVVMNDSTTKPVTRRDFLGIAAVATFFVTLVISCLGMMRLIVPKVFPELSKRYKIGSPKGFPAGEIRVPQGRSVHVFHDKDGFYAISSICTHLGCIITLKDAEFICPCHGSRFALNGDVISGAAPKALDWYTVSLAPDGQLVVDEGKTIKPQTYFKV